jgi:hypothetical protein
LAIDAKLDFRARSFVASQILFNRHWDWGHGKMKRGSSIRIKCQVKRGPFAGERLVAFETLEGLIAGLVQDRDLISDQSEWFLHGVVQDVGPQSIAVRVPGSFFTANGIAVIQRETAMAALISAQGA